jgi:hypothetical protein
MLKICTSPSRSIIRDFSFGKLFSPGIINETWDLRCKRIKITSWIKLLDTSKLSRFWSIDISVGKFDILFPCKDSLGS